MNIFLVAACGENTILGGWAWRFCGSAGTKLTLNQDLKHGKENYVSQKTLMLVFTKLNLINEAELVV
jgi:hypothetical protein